MFMYTKDESMKAIEKKKLNLLLKIFCEQSRIDNTNVCSSKKVTNCFIILS